MDAKKLALSIGADWKTLSEKSVPVVYDSDEGPSSLQMQDSPTLSYSSSKKDTDRTHNGKRKKQSSGLFCCMAKNVGKKHRPTP